MAGAGNPAQAQPNAFQQAAQGIQAAGLGSYGTMAFRPQDVGTDFGYDPSQVGTQFGYDPSQVGTQFGYDPARVSAQTAAGGIGTYMNPYTQQVIDRAQQDIERQRQMAMNKLGAQAGAAGAFGGSRQGVAESLTNREFARQSADTAAQLRAQGFQTALGASQQDVAQNLQAALANQAAGARAAEFGQQTGLQAQMANQAARAQAEQFGQQTGLQAQMANQQAGARAAEFGQQQGLQAQLANQAAARNAAALRLQGAGQLADISNLGFGRAMDITRQQQQQGLAMQALNQQIIDAAKAQYAGFTGAPERALQLPIAAVSAGNMGQGTTTATTQQQPGLLNYLSLGASLAAAPMATASGAPTLMGSLFPSDRRLKTNIKPYAERNGLTFYTWDWNEEGKRVADPAQPTIGVMADELQATHPHLVHKGSDGYLRVDYGGLAGELGVAV